MINSNERTEWALFSLTDKRGCEGLAKLFVERGVRIISSGGTKRYLEEHGIEAMDISDFTGEPERFGGRVKTLHHKIYSSLLLRPDSESDWKQWPEGHQIVAVVCNFYPFQEKVSEAKSMDAMIEWIDIGGPCMVRAAAKNAKHVWVFTNPSQYESFLEKSWDERVNEHTRYTLALEAFELVRNLDNAIADEWHRRSLLPYFGEAPAEKEQVSNDSLEKWTFEPNMKYGENPHQKASYTRLTNQNSAEFLGPVGFNNVRDAEAAWKFVEAFSKEQAAVAVVKHQTLCGACASPNLSQKEEAFSWAWEGDPVSRFGGIVAFNHLPGSEATTCLQKNFVELVVLPKTKECRQWAEKLRASKPRCRFVLVNPFDGTSKESFTGRLGMLSQDCDFEAIPSKVTNTKSMQEFWIHASAWMGACSKSNALVLTLQSKNGSVVLAGAGQGQPNRVEAFDKLAWPRAQEFLERFGQFSVKDLLLYSDAFLPFTDLIESMAQAKVKKLVQPGGSKNDSLILEKAKELGVDCTMTGVRHFWH